jgi:hypothetical protein
VLTDKELSAPVWNRIFVAVMELIAKELKEAFSKNTSPAVKLLTFIVLKDANRAANKSVTFSVLTS